MADQANSDVFGSAPDKAQNVGTNANVFSIPDPAKEYVGEGKKYASVEAALASIPHAQSHISNLEKELADMRTEVNKMKAEGDKVKALDEVISKLENQGKTTQQAPVQPAQDIGEVVKTVMRGEIEASKKAANQEEANNKMVSLFGDKATEMVVNKAKELGVGLDFLKTTAQSSPQAFYKLMGIQETDKQQDISFSSGKNTEAMGAHNKPPETNAKVPMYAGTKDLLDGWRRAGKAIGK